MMVERKKILKSIVNKVINWCFYGILLFTSLMLLQIFCLTSFKIPSDSMEPTLEAGDRILVDKWSLGARIFNVFKALRHEDVPIYRMPGLRSIQRNDIVVFNFPYAPTGWDSISFDVMRYYVKRCVALPGDTLCIKNGFFSVNGFIGNLGNMEAQRKICQLPDSLELTYVCMRTFPWNDNLNWTIKNFGPLPVPQKGQKVALNALTISFYKQLIEWELKRKLTVRGDTVWMGSKQLIAYTFNENYYFVAGDKGENSQDSRYWGLLPEPYIVGKAVLIWKSVDKYTNKIRWERFLKCVR